jgi:predicted transposase/invertase (TIGR01784 family)
MTGLLNAFFGSKESGPVLLGFLNDLLHDGQGVITEVEIMDPYLPSQIRHLNSTAVDVRATLAGGGQVLIEMQMLPVANFRERALYNAAKCLVSQLGRGAKYEKIRPVTLITIADCMLLPETTRWRNHYCLQERQTGANWPAHGLELVFVELPKVDPGGLPYHEPMHDWLEFLKNADTWRKVPASMKNPAVRQATRMARFDSLLPAESKAMTARQLYRADQRNMRRHALEEGRKEGLQQGLQEGLQKGIHQGMQKGMQQGRQLAALDIACALLARGMDAKTVAETTGLPLRAVSRLSAGETRPSAKAARRGVK